MNSDRITSVLAVFTVALVMITATSYVIGADAGAEESATDHEPSGAAEEFDELSSSEPVSVLYRGVLQAEDGNSVGGVFPLKFHLYRSDISAEPLWSEEHYVSVVDGRYQVVLGEKSPLPQHLLAGERWLGVELRDEGDVLRDQITVERPGDDGAANGELTHADVADRARMAEDAMAVGGMSAEEIEEMTDEVLERLADHIADPNAHDAVAGPTVSNRRRTAGDEAGGTGGSSYEITCPEGHVATGIRGGAGRVVDSITLLCSPLE